MRPYLMQRLLLVVPTLFGVSVLVAALVRLVPGGVESMFCPDGCTAAQRQEIRAALGTDKPFVVQYLDWAQRAVRGDLGASFQTKRPVTDDIRARLPVTFQLGLMAMAVALLIALPVGVLAAVRQDSPPDYVARGAATALMSIPSFWLGTVVIAYGGKLWNWAPPLTWHSFAASPADNLAITLIPAIILGAALAGTIMRLTRAQMLEVMRQDYIRTAWSKGLRERTVLVRHALRNAFIPVITLIGLQLPVLFGGAVIIETIFNVPGIGRYLVTAIGQRDFPIIQGVNLVIATVILLTNLLIDVSYGVIDPRVRT